MAGVTQEDVFDILELFRASRFARIELCAGPVRIAVDRAPAADASEIAASGEASADITGIVNLAAPLLGTFDARAVAGESVDADTTVAIIRVLDSATEVKAGVSGTVREVLAKDGELVEFGQPLLRITPSS